MAGFDCRINTDFGIAGRFRGADIAHQQFWSSLSWAEPSRGASDFLGLDLTREPNQVEGSLSHTRVPIRI